MKPIRNRGRTWEAVTTPRNFAPFTYIRDQEDFDRAWQDNPDWVLAQISHAAYHNKSYLEQQFEKFGAQVHFYQSQPDGSGVVMGRQGFMAIWPDKAILAFRGTEIDEQIEIEVSRSNLLLRWLKRKYPWLFKIPFIPADIADDFYAIPVTHKEESGKSKVHKGFYLAIEELWPQLINELHALQAQNKPIYATGHSLGGAMALLAAVKEDITKVVTFGMPAAGNNLEQTIPSNCQHIRYVNGRDPVTKLVPKFLFKHHGEEIKILDIDGPQMRYDHSIINYAVILKDKNNIAD